MGSRLHAGTTGGGGAPTNDGRRRAIPQSSFPRRRESTARAGDGVPSPRELRAAAAHPQTTVGGGRSHNRHSRDGGNPQRGAGDGFPSPRELRAAAAGAPTNDGRRRAIPQSSFPRRRESTARARRWVPVSTGTTVGGGGRTHKGREAAGAPTNDSGRRAIPQSSFPRRRENPRRGAGDGFPSPRGNDGRRRRTHKRRGRRAIPQSSFPRRRESTARAGDGVPVSTGTKVGGGGRTNNRHSRDGGKIHGEGPAMGSRLHGNYGRRRQAHPQTTVGGGRSHNRHSRDGGKIHGGGPAMGSRLHGNDGRQRAIPQTTVGGGRRTHKLRAAAAHPQSPGVGRSIRPINSEQLR